MTIHGEYVPSPTAWVREQVEAIETAGTTEATDIRGMKVVLVTMLGVSGKVRKVPVMRVEHDGAYAMVASKGGAPDNPAWYANLKKNPVCDLMDGTTTRPVRAREIHGAERAGWWPRCVAAFPPYADYQTKTDRVIPVFVLEPVDA